MSTVSTRPVRSPGRPSRPLLAAATLAALVAAAPLPAQFGDPRDKIREIAEEVAEQMQEIDRLLLQSNPSRGAAGGADVEATPVRELLDRTTEGQRAVVDKIDVLIEELSRLEGGGQGGGSPRQSRPQQSRPQPGTQQRDPTARPDVGERPEGGQDPSEGRDRPERGENRPGDQPPEDPTERATRTRVDDRWGDLPFYEEFLKSRGGAPEVPEKYRRFQEAYLKQGSRDRQR